MPVIIEKPEIEKTSVQDWKTRMIKDAEWHYKYHAEKAEEYKNQIAALKLIKE